MWKITSLFFLFIAIVQLAIGQQNDSAVSKYNYSLKELSQLTISTGSIKPEKLFTAPSNITVITSNHIKQRGYETLIDVCEDIPGFDFLTFNDGGGEYPTYNLHRGLGEIGNSEILVLIDGIVQNNISFNWSALWTHELMLIDVDRIEFIQGPGSVLYGAQAFTGVIHVITKKNYSGLKATSLIGSYKTYANEIAVGSTFKNNINLSLAFKKLNAEGDMGLNRYDPANYFKNNTYPDTILANYNNIGEYIENQPNKIGGKPIPNGFNTTNNTYVLRGKINYKTHEIGGFVSDMQRGNASQLLAYEYDVTNKQHFTHFKTFHTYYKNAYSISKKISLRSQLVFRGTHILPNGGNYYLYRFPQMLKGASSYAYQTYVQEDIIYSFNKTNVLLFGLKSVANQKSERVISLNGDQINRSTTSSSWDAAVNGQGINIQKQYPKHMVHEAATYAHWDKQWSTHVSTSAGIRLDYSAEYNYIATPRFAIDYNPLSAFGAKLMFGTAFRQPSIFELTSEFRGNKNLLPQKNTTTELEFNSLTHSNKLKLKLNVYYSKINDMIGKVPDNTMPAGERYENIERKNIGGLSVSAFWQITSNIRAYSNYNYLTGVNTNTVRFYNIERTATHKINTGISLSLINNKLSASFRTNYVGKRKAQLANTWLQNYNNGFAPAYLKCNLSAKYKLSSSISMQIVINNLFNEQYYGIGWETGSGFIDDYHYQENINPTGHIPAYHPQPGRTIFLKLILSI